MIDSLMGLQRLGQTRARLLGSAGKGNPSVVAAAEASVQRAPAKAITFDEGGFATLMANGHRWAGGRFSVPSLEELATRVKGRSGSGSKPALRLSLLVGADPLTDIGSLQALADRDTLFQVASQFNCLEAPGPHIVRVASYFGDPTQGPRASISAFPGTLVRHYAAPGEDGQRFVQSDSRQIDLLRNVFPPQVAAVRNGYLTSHDIRDAGLAASMLESNFMQCQIGLHEEVQVALGYNWDGSVDDSANRLISQVFTSTFAGGGYSSAGKLAGHRDEICTHLLRASYLGTLLGAAALGKHKVVLTLIGGGVFGNPTSLILESIVWAARSARDIIAEPMEVFVNNWAGVDLAGTSLERYSRESGGIVCEISSGQARISSSLDLATTRTAPTGVSQVTSSTPRGATSRSSHEGETWVAVADLHGHRDHLKALLGFLDRELGDSYRLCTLGDYVDNGPDVPELLEDLISLKSARGDRFVPIIGNHDFAMIRSLGWPEPGVGPDENWYDRWGSRFWNARLGTPEIYARWQNKRVPRNAKEFARLVPETHRAFLEGLPWVHDTGAFIFVHAGMEKRALGPQVEELVAKRLPPDHLHTPPQLREKALSKARDECWERTVVSAHNKQLGMPRFVERKRICLSGEIDATGILHAVVLSPDPAWVVVSPDLSIRFEPSPVRAATHSQQTRPEGAV